MKRTVIIIIIALATSAIFFSFKSRLHYAKALSRPPKEDIIDRYYWFPVRAKIDDSENKYTISNAGRIKYGSLEKFDKDLWQNLRRRMILVGPFMSKDQAVMARSFYTDKPEKVKIKWDTNAPSTVYWFGIHFIQSPRLRIYIINRIPASVFPGPVTEFKKAFFVQLQQQQLPIGPFYMADNAENAKRIYRRNE